MRLIRSVMSARSPGGAWMNTVFDPSSNETRTPVICADSLVNRLA